MNNYRKSNHFPIPYKPIPLTEEWLLKFGFEYDEEATYWVIKNNIAVEIDSFRVVRQTYFEDDVIYNDVSKKVKHVHQLQNLYFALTNEELEIKQ